MSTLFAVEKAAPALLDTKCLSRKASSKLSCILAI